MSERNELVIAAIFKGEDPYLREWIEYHRLVGVSHFYLYDNGGDPASRRVLAPYIESGVVTWHDWSMYGKSRWKWGRNQNHRAFAHCARNYRDRFGWVMKIDIDEFLFPQNDERDCLQALAALGDDVKGLRIPRINYGDCGHRSPPEGLVLESYWLREAEASDHKDLASGRTISTNRWNNSAHSWSHRWLAGGRVLHESEVRGLVVKHYYTKSLEEFLSRQNPAGGRIQTEARFRERNEGRNDVEDRSMFEFVPEIRRRLEALPPA